MCRPCRPAVARQADRRRVHLEGDRTRCAERRVCFVLPHGVLFNHSTTALPFQKAWVRAHSIDRVLNLADFQRFLFEKAGHPAVVVRYRKPAPSDMAHRIEYWGPKADWTVTKAEVITIAPQDRHNIDGRPGASRP